MPATSDSIRRAQPLLGTFVDISAAGASSADLETAIDAAFAAVADVHRLMSFHDRHSDVGRLNREAAAGAVPVHPWTFQVLEAAAEMHRLSLGTFDIAVAPALQELGLLPRWAEDRPGMKAVPAGAIELRPGGRVRFGDPAMRIDLGGIAKGFAVDRAIDVLRQHGAASGLVNAGGDLAAFGPHVHTIDIRDPRDPGRLMCRVDVNNQALASSGPCFDPYRSADTTQLAVIEPDSGAPARTIAGATVRAPSCMIADALTKVVVIAGEAAATPLEHYRASAIFISADGDVCATSDWGDHQHAN